MNIKNINLNLLVALDLLLTEKNVTRAGEKLFVSQSAMSNILKQLREIFNDELLIMKGRNMQLTSRAQELYPQIKQFILQAESILLPNDFDPKTCQHKFVLGMEEYTNFILLPDLYAYLNQQAPRISIEVKHIPYFDNKSKLESHEIEMAIGLSHITEESSTLYHECLFKERLVCIAHKKNKIFNKRLTLKKYLQADHVSLSLNQKSLALIIDQTLTQMGYSRNIALKLEHIVPALYAIEKSNLIATVPEGIALEASRLLDLKIQPCPFALQPISFALSWHPRTESSKSHQWLRNIIKHIAQKKKSSRGQVVP